MNLYSYCIGYYYAGLIRAENEESAVKILNKKYKRWIDDKTEANVTEIDDDKFDKFGVWEQYTF